LIPRIETFGIGEASERDRNGMAVIVLQAAKIVMFDERISFNGSLIPRRLSRQSISSLLFTLGKIILEGPIINGPVLKYFSLYYR